MTNPMNTHNSTETAPVDSAGLSHEINRLLSEYIALISKRLGISIHSHQINELKKIIQQACNEFQLKPADYLQKLQECRDDSPPLTFLVSGITIGETYFFRDTKQMNLLRDNILPALIRKKREINDLSLRIWSAGCSSGEEIYTIAMMLRQLLPDIQLWRLQLLGTDINTTMLKKAVSGHYSEWSMRSIPESLKKAFFVPEKGGYTLTPETRRMAVFNWLNLHDDNWPSMLNSTNAQDLILCRNVLIYFNSDSVDKLMKKMATSLVEDGYLLLGASDPVNTKIEGLYFHYTQGMLFSRIPPAVKSVSTPRKIAPSIPHPARTLSVAVQSTKKQPLPVPLVFQSTPSLSVDTVEVQDMLKEARWKDILSLTEAIEKTPSRNNTLINARAKALTNLGKLREAVAFCRSNMTGTDNIELMLMLSMALAELNQSAEAEAELRKILYLDHQCVMAHYQLGLLLLRNRKKIAGLKCLKNAVVIAATKKAEDTVPGCEGLNYGSLTEILARETEVHSAGETK